jgi:DnaJ-domain-containing protein 1
VPNYFSTFGESQRPWLNEEALKRKFLELSTERHPDKAAGAEAKAAAEGEFSELNQAYNTLRSTRARLLHLFELEGLPKPEHMQDVPPDVIEFFPIVAEITRNTDALLKERAAADSPMLRIQFAGRALDRTDKIQAVQARIRDTISNTERRVQELDGAWEKDRAAIVPKLQRAAATLGFLERWNAQLQERLIALAF